MRLCDALNVQTKQVIAAVGAGGKTALLGRLAAELAAAGACVVFTTTTAIWEPSGPLVIDAEERGLIDAVARLSQPGRQITAASGRRLVAEWPGGPQRAKLVGVSPHVPGLLLALPGVQAVVVEADGARGRAIKAPAAHEPVIPPNTACVLAVVSIEALGEPLNAENAHRPEQIAALLGLALGTPLGPRHIAALLAHPQGGRKGVPTGARFVPFINKVEDGASLRAARAIAALLRSQPGIDHVLIGAALAHEPVLEVW